MAQDNTTNDKHFDFLSNEVEQLTLELSRPKAKCVAKLPIIYVDELDRKRKGQGLKEARTNDSTAGPKRPFTSDAKFLCNCGTSCNGAHPKVTSQIFFNRRRSCSDSKQGLPNKHQSQRAMSEPKTPEKKLLPENIYPDKQAVPEIVVKGNNNVKCLDQGMQSKQTSDENGNLSISVTTPTNRDTNDSADVIDLAETKDLKKTAKDEKQTAKDKMFQERSKIQNLITLFDGKGKELNKRRSASITTSEKKNARKYNQAAPNVGVIDNNNANCVEQTKQNSEIGNTKVRVKAENSKDTNESTDTMAVAETKDVKETGKEEMCQEKLKIENLITVVDRKIKELNERQSASITSSDKDPAHRNSQTLPKVGTKGTNSDHEYFEKDSQNKPKFDGNDNLEGHLKSPTNKTTKDSGNPVDVTRNKAVKKSGNEGKVSHPNTNDSNDANNIKENGGNNKIESKVKNEGDNESNGQKKRKRRRRNKRNESNSSSGEDINVLAEDDKNMKNKGKITQLYLILCDKIPMTKRLDDFIKYRMGNPKTVYFNVVSVEAVKNASGCTLITLDFPSNNKASKAQSLLNESSRKSDSKIHCFFNRKEALGETKNLKKDRQEEMYKAIKHLVGMVGDGVKKHDTKIDAYKKQVKDVVDQLEGKRGGVHYEVFAMLCDEKDAITDKLTELKLQKKEFRIYTKVLRSKLAEAVEHKNFDHEIKEIRKAVGVECFRLEKALPMYARREDILNTVRDNQVSVVLGETGSGKSTQMVQYLHQAGFASDGLIVCTQPRKIAAVSLATHVSKEMASNVGQVVGYHVGMQQKKTALTKVMFMTDHILLNECLKDRTLSKYTCIIIDEAHERSVYTDLLLGLIKQCLEQRPDLRVVITSATIDPDVFVRYFGGSSKCPVLKVSGRTFPVDVIWEEYESMLDAPFPQNYESKALSKAIEIHRDPQSGIGDILVFLTSAVETERCVERFIRAVGTQDNVCLQLHGKLRTEQQQLVFEKPPPGKRKVVFATNSAETSITIDGIKFVIDTGVVKEMRFDPKKNMSSLDVVSVSQSSANQRKGRAGRTSHGTCYRLYTEHEYNGMKKTGTPEILRIQVAQAVLKLLELGVDPLSFDYVEAPSKDAMRQAVVELEDIEAIDDNKITEAGKWISKLPLEPKFGMMVKQGVDLGIHSEILVVASCCSQSGIFYRAGSVEDKKDADMKKLKFCHEGGDLLTMLTVYKEWEQQPERKKGQWCRVNCVNGKSMKAVRDMMNEIITILKKELGLHLKHAFADPSTSNDKVKQLVFQCLRGNLGYYLGHENAGYLVVKNHQRVKIHPSSTLPSLAMQPTWVVYNRLLRTSDDFMTDVTPVETSLIEKAKLENRISIDETALEGMRVQKAITVPVGRHVFWKFVGPQHQRRRDLEEEISMVCNNTTVVIDAVRQRGEVVLFSVAVFAEVAADMLKEDICPLSAQLINERLEEGIFNKSGKATGTRVLLGAGGNVVSILSPSQYRSLNIKEKGYTQYALSQTEIEDRLACYGNIEDLWKTTGKKNQNSMYWGRVTFTHEEDAIDAEKDVNDDEDLEFSLVPIRFNTQVRQMQHGYTMKITWCRRPAKGHCFIELNRPEDLVKLNMSDLKVNGRTHSIRLAKKGESLFVGGLGSQIDTSDIIAGLEECLGLPIGSSQDRFKVFVPRENASMKANDIQESHSSLSAILRSYTDAANFKIHIIPYRQQTMVVLAFVTFSDIVTAESVCRNIQDERPCIGSQAISADMEFKSGIHVIRRVFKLVEPGIHQLMKHYKNSSSTTIEIRELKSGHFSIDIKSTKLEKLARVKVRFDKIIEGYILSDTNTSNIQLMFSLNGRDELRQIEKSTKTIITTDERNTRITVQGVKDNITNAVEKILRVIDYCENKKEQEMRLKGDDNPPGLMKALYLRYGLKFKGLQRESGLSSIKINMRFHEICMVGSEAALTKAVELVKVERDKLTVTTVAEDDMPDCPICLCPVEETDMCRLEFCGHAYCKPCLTQQVLTAVKDREFPITCSVENCNKELVIRDFKAQIKSGTIKQAMLAIAALNAFVASNGSYKFCITPDCPMVYNVTEDGDRFVCSICGHHICTKCQLEYHDGLTCAMYESAKKYEDSVLKWIRDDPNNRKKCPKCDSGIEKIEGCDHMTCKCGAHICWKCLEYFNSCRDCYRHLQTVHGSFV